MQDPKYEFLHGLVMNRHTGEIIPADEPVFVFRARDLHAAKAIHFYSVEIAKHGGETEHFKAVLDRVADFQRFADEHPERMKEPDTPA